MSLEEELAAQRSRAYARRPPEERRVRASAIEDIVRSGVARGALRVGDRAPHFALPDSNDRLVDVDRLLHEGPVVLSFYRGGWCPYCNLELRALQAQYAAIRQSGGDIVAIAPELPARAASTGVENVLMFPLLFDQDNHVAHLFRLVHRIDPRVVDYQLRNGNDVAAFNGSAIAEVPVPATYVIDRAGVIRYAFVDADYTRRAEPSDVLTALQACVSQEAKRRLQTVTSEILTD
jgi:peroxiredoxin